MGGRVPALWALAAVILSACTGGDTLDLAFADVASGEVVETIAAPATVEPIRRVSVSAPLTGVVEELLVSDGDEVEAGQVLIRLSSDPLELQIAQAEAALNAARALGNVGPAFDLSPLFVAAQGQLGVIPPLLDALQAQAEQVDDPQTRAQLLAQVREARWAYRDAVRSLQEAEEQAAASAQASTASQRAAASAQRVQAETALAAAESQADRLEIRAPSAGTVELARPTAGGGDAPLGDLGSLLGGGTGTTATGLIAEGSDVVVGQALLTIFDLSSFRIEATIDEVDAVRVVTGQAATVLVEAVPESELVGRVIHIAVEPRTGPAGGVTFPVTVELVDAPEDLALRVGLSASVEIEVARIDADRVVPSSALLRRGGQEIVFVERNGAAVEVAVTVEAIGDDDAAVTGDLEVGERVVSRGVELLEDGDRVQ